MQSVEPWSEQVSTRSICRSLRIPRSSLYCARKKAAVQSVEPSERTASPRGLTAEEKIKVLEKLNSPQYQDQSPREVYADLLDQEEYLCSPRTMYRILAENKEIRERRNQLRHPKYVKPELLATKPNQLWSWDITKLLGPTKWTYYYLYTIIDVFSRYVVGWMIAERELASLAEELIAVTCIRQGIQPGQLTIHADRGSSMTSKPVALLMADLGVTKTHSRPHVSNDNPFSESHFKTMKYRPDYPDYFGSIQDARAWAEAFFQWYNHQHHHNSLVLLTPAVVHFGKAEQFQEKRQQVLQAAFTRHPERFVRGAPRAGKLPSAVWINPPKAKPEAERFLVEPLHKQSALPEVGVPVKGEVPQGCAAQRSTLDGVTAGKRIALREAVQPCSMDEVVRV
jgi:putative transposase